MKNRITKIRQVSIVCPDIEKMIKFYSEVLGFDEWKRTELNDETLKQYPHYVRGKENFGTFKVAIGMVCNIQIEFMQPINEDSIYMEFLKANNYKPRMHHLFVEVDNYEEMYKEMSQRYEKLQEATTPFGSSIVYFDTQDDMGFIFETYRTLNP